MSGNRSGVESVKMLHGGSNLSSRISGIVLVVAVAAGAIAAGCSTAARPSASGSPATTAAGATPMTTSASGLPGVSSPAVPSTTPTTASGAVCGVVPAANVTVTDESGCQVRASLGADIEVELGPSMRWSTPSSDSAAVTVVSSYRPTAGGLQAILRASAPGRATVTADGVAVCSSGEVCPALAELWRVTITVS